MNEQTAVTVAPTMMALTGISKNYDGVAALTNVDLTIRAGEVHALLGENGAGKSTLVGIASGAIAPDGGVIAMGEDTFARLTPAQATDLRHHHRPSAPGRSAGHDGGREHPGRRAGRRPDGER